MTAVLRPDRSDSQALLGASVDTDINMSPGLEPDADRRSGDSINQLARRLNEQLTQAVDPLQVAAFLEAEGLNDRLVRKLYDYPDVFALAFELYQRVPLRLHVVPPDASDRSPWIALSYVLRGLIYALPGLFYVALAQVISAKALIFVVIPSLIFAWGWNQASTYLGYRLIGRRQIDGAKRLVRRSFVVGTSISFLLALTVSLLALGDAWVAILAVAQSAYLLASAILLLLRRDDVLAIGLVPGVIISVLVVTGVNIPFAFIVSILGLTLATVIGGAWYVTRPDRAVPAIGLRIGDMVSSLPYMALGLVWSSTLAVSLAVTGGLGEQINVTLPVIPLILSMGVAEWQTHWLMDRSQEYLKSTSDLGLFHDLAWSAFGRALGIYVLGLAAISGVAIGIDSLTGVFQPEEALLFLAYGSLGVAFFAGLTLVAVSLVNLVVGYSGAMLGLFGLGGLILHGSAGIVLPLYSMVMVVLAAGLLGASRASS